jgi:hypothetical protein
MAEIVYLTQEEINNSLKFVEEMREDKHEHSVKDKKFDAKNTSYAVNLMGHLGEQAAARVYGGTVDTSVRTGGDDGYDLHIGGLRYQVKTSTTRDLIFNAPELFSADRAILVTLIGDRTQPHIGSYFIVWGHISRERFMEVFRYHDYGYGKRLVCSLEYLTPPGRTDDISTTSMDSNT